MPFGKRGNLAGATLVLLAIVLVLAGCGGGSTDSSESTSSLTKAEFVKKGNAICTQT
jgi:ABC-type glycerol-3-phosphate transport system substrate-binding protein